MKHLIAALLVTPVIVSTQPTNFSCPSGQFFVVGCLDSIDQFETPTVSTQPATSVILKSRTSPDCYRITVSPNGTLGTQWTVCPQ